MTVKSRFTIVAILGAIAVSIFAASPADAHGWGWGHRHYPSHRYYGHYRHYDRYPSSYGKIVINLPGRFVSVVVGGKRYYHCDGAYYRRSGHYFESVASPYGSSTVYRGQDDHWGDGDDRGGRDEWRDRD